MEIEKRGIQMKCRNCGRQLDESSKFCAFCGTSQYDENVKQTETKEPSEESDGDIGLSGSFGGRCRKGGSQAKIIAAGVSICLALFVVAILLTTCFGPGEYYRLDKFASQSGSKIVDELESGQGLEFAEVDKYIDYAWAGVPKDAVEPCDGMLVHFEDENQERELSRDDLNDGASVGAAYLYWSGDRLEHWSDASSRVDSIMKKCGFGSVIHEGQTTFGTDGWERIGKCRLNGKDAYWGIGITKEGKVSVAVKQLRGDTSYGELSEGVNMMALMA